MPQGKGMRGNGGGGGSGGGGSGGGSGGSRRAPCSSVQEGIDAFDGPGGSVADSDRSDEVMEIEDSHHHDRRDHQSGAKGQGEALRGRFSYLDIADRVKCLLTNADDHVRQPHLTMR